MAKYTSKPFVVDKPAAEVSDKFADLTVLKAMVVNLPESERAKVGDIDFEPDSIKLTNPQIGDIRFRVTERTPNKVVMKAEGTPVPLKLDIDLKADTADTTSATCGIDVEIPMMLKTFLGPKLQQAVDMLSSVIERAIK